MQIEVAHQMTLRLGSLSWITHVGSVIGGILLTWKRGQKREGETDSPVEPSRKKLLTLSLLLNCGTNCKMLSVCFFKPQVCGDVLQQPEKTRPPAHVKVSWQRRLLVVTREGTW